MKKLLAILLVVTSCISFYGCSKDDDIDTSEEIDEVIATEASTTVDNKEEASITSEDETDTTHEEIDGYQYANFEKYNSYAEDNGLKDTLVYIQGEVKSVHEHENTCMLSVISEDGGRWVVAFLGVEYSDEIKELLDGKSVVCFGNYRGFSDVFQMPAIYADKVNNSLKTYTIEDLMKYSNFISEESATEKPTTIVTEPVTEKQTEQSTNAEDTFTKLYDDDNITLYYCSTEKYKYENETAIVKFFVENRTDKVISVISGLMVLDGISYNKSTLADEISANSKGYIEAHIDDITNFEPSSIGLQFTYGEQYGSYDSKVRVDVIETKIE